VSKKLPYFQFEPAQYYSGNIQFCSFESQGLFINICVFYWERDCELTINQINKKWSRPELLDELLKEDIIKVDGNNIIVEFLDEQYELVTATKISQSIGGKKGAEVKKQLRLDAEGNVKRIEITKKIEHVPFPNVKIDVKVEQFFKDLDSGDAINTISSQINIPVETLKSKLDYFKKSCRTTYANYEEFKFHFKMWVQKFIKAEQQQPKTKYKSLD
jgi:hypothetical protein